MEAECEEGFKLLPLGNGGVGKSSLIMRYVKDTFSQELSSSTIGFDYLRKARQSTNSAFNLGHGRPRKIQNYPQFVF